MRNAALPIDWGHWGFLSPSSSLFLIPSYACVFAVPSGCGRIRLASCTCVLVRIVVSRDNRGKRKEKNAGTNLGTVRMEMPCRCYSHLHSDFRYKPLCPRPSAWTFLCFLSSLFLTVVYPLSLLLFFCRLRSFLLLTFYSTSSSTVLVLLLSLRGLELTTGWNLTENLLFLDLHPFMIFW